MLETKKRDKKGIAIVALLVLGVGSALLLSKKAEAVPVARRPPCSNAGDLNDDGFVTREDYDLLAQYILEAESLSPDQVSRADLNGDGSVSVLDLSLMDNYIVGAIDTFPVCAVIYEGVWIYQTPQISLGNIIDGSARFMSCKLAITNSGLLAETREVTFFARKPPGAWQEVGKWTISLGVGESWTRDIVNFGIYYPGDTVEVYAQDNQGQRSATATVPTL